MEQCLLTFKKKEKKDAIQHYFDDVLGTKTEQCGDTVSVISTWTYHRSKILPSISVLLVAHRSELVYKGFQSQQESKNDFSIYRVLATRVQARSRGGR